MNKKKVITLRPFNLVNTTDIKISKYNGEDYLFEIGKNVTQDITEAVVLMMRSGIDKDNTVWSTEIRDVNTYEISPRKSLYWLTGGDDEWMAGSNYKYPWHECVTDFTEEFGEEIIDIIKNAKTLLDVRNGIMERLNLPILFEFALESNLI
jgi:hypothetical protein